MAERQAGASIEALAGVKGMNDMLPFGVEPFLNSHLWAKMLERIAHVVQGYGYGRVWLPLVEKTALFARGVGEQSDIVTKEMYTFEDRGGRSLTLRPEGTASAVRSYIQHRLPHQEPVQRWWYLGPMYRAERPQKGRYRQFYQVGVEFFGVDTLYSDVEMLAMSWQILRALGLQEHVTLQLNSLGDPPTREKYRQALRDFLKAHFDTLCDNCQQRAETNPLRALDCKNAACQSVLNDAPDIADSFTPAAQAYLQSLCQALDDMQLPYQRQPRLVRGLDYYTGMIFEFVTETLGAQGTVLGGGRYDGLVQDLGGPSTPAIGFAMGLERLALMMAELEQHTSRTDLYLIPMPGAESDALHLAEKLRALDGTALRIDVDVSGKKLKHQMRRADRLGALSVLVLGDDEIGKSRATLKRMTRKEAVEVQLQPEAIAAVLKAWRLEGNGR